MNWLPHPFDPHPGIPGECRVCPLAESASVHHAAPAQITKVGAPATARFGCGCVYQAGDEFQLGVRANGLVAEAYCLRCEGTLLPELGPADAWLLEPDNLAVLSNFTLRGEGPATKGEAAEQFHAARARRAARGPAIPWWGWLGLGFLAVASGLAGRWWAS